MTCEFRKKVVQICKDLWPENYLQMANNLMACMALETATTFNPKIDNHLDQDDEGFGYVGLIQFGNDAITDLSRSYGNVGKLRRLKLFRIPVSFRYGIFFKLFVYGTTPVKLPSPAFLSGKSEKRSFITEYEFSSFSNIG